MLRSALVSGGGAQRRLQVPRVGGFGTCSALLFPSAVSYFLVLLRLWEIKQTLMVKRGGLRIRLDRTAYENNALIALVGPSPFAAAYMKKKYQNVLLTHFLMSMSRAASVMTRASTFRVRFRYERLSY